MSERNEELFRAVADQIELHPETYDQDEYFRVHECGTTACIAGWAVVLGEHHGTLQQAAKDLDGLELGRAAARLLGLTDEEALCSVDSPTATPLFAYYWQPHDGLSVSDALRKIGEGAAIEDVSA